MVQPDDLFQIIEKGSVGAYVGQQKPKKLDDERYLGKPEDIKETYDKTVKRR